MLKLKIFFISVLRFLERESKWFIAIFLALLIVLLLLIRFQKELFKPVVSEGIIGTYTEKNLPILVTSLLSSPLVNVDKDGKPTPGLATSWQSEKESSEYTFKLKNNAYWSDGTKVKASEVGLPIPDVALSFPDDNTIQFKLAESFSPFPNLLDHPVFRGDSLVGTGPYKIAQIKKDNVFISKLVLAPLDPSLPRLVIRFYPNEKTAKNALRLGEVQALLGINDTEDFAQDNTLALYSRPNFNQVVTIFYNTKDAILSDENMRLALSFGAPLIKDETEAVTSIPTTSWAFNKEVKDYLDNDVQKTASLKKVQKGKDETITLTATSFLRDVGERVVEAWNQRGIKAKLRIESGVPQNFQALLITQNIPSDPDQYSLWHSTQQQTNIAKFSNPRVDKDLEDGRKVADFDVRKQKYQDFQKVLLDHAPATFLYFPKYNVVYMKKVEPQLQKILDLQLSSI